VIDGKTGDVVIDLRPFGTFQGGVFVTLGDVDRDGINDIVITPDQGGGPRVQIIRGGTFAKLADFFGIADPEFRGGARAGVGDLNRDGFADIVVSAGFAGGPRIAVFDGSGIVQGRFVRLVNDFFAFPDALRNGTYVTVGDVNGDGVGDLVIGAGPGGGPQVLVIDGNALLTQGAAAAVRKPMAIFFAGDESNRGGVRVTAKNLDGDNFADIVTGAGEGGGSGVTAYRGSALARNTLDLMFGFESEPGYQGGVFVG